MWGSNTSGSCLKSADTITRSRKGDGQTFQMNGLVGSRIYMGLIKTRTDTHAHECWPTHPHTHTHTHTHRHRHMHMHMDTHTHTHTHTHTKLFLGEYAWKPIFLVGRQTVSVVFDLQACTHGQHLAHAQTHTHTGTKTKRDTHTHTLKHTQTHTQRLPLNAVQDGGAGARHVYGRQKRIGSENI